MTLGSLLILLRDTGPMTWAELRDCHVTSQQMNVAHAHQLIAQESDARWAITDTGRKAIP